MSAAAPLVSVVVPTYASGPGLDRLVASLDAQSLPVDRFEVVFVDDGSPDGTVERLRAIASTRPNVRVERIENSGWASRPRNVGIDLAAGEYVLFMDHDDELYPDALRAAAEWGVRHHADVVNGKEARTHDAGWALATYREDRGQDVGRTDAHPLIPMNPHKLYRRAFLQEHGITFPEGRRVLWEDIFFNLQVAQHARTVSTLASTPFYHWVQTTGSGSTTFLRSDPEWWNHLERVLESIERHLEHDDLQRRQLLRHQYGTRVLASFVPGFLRRPDAEQDMIIERARGLQERFFPPAADETVDRSALAIARALRRGERASLVRLASVAGTDRFGRPEVVSARWVDGALSVRARAATVERDGGGTFPVDAGRILPFPPAMLEGLGDLSDFDLRDELSAIVGQLTVRGRTSRVGWAVADADVEVRVSETGDRASAEILVTARIDPSACALGAPLGDEVWDVFLRIDRAGRIQCPRLASSGRPAAALVDGRMCVAYSNREGNLSLDIGEQVASAFDAGVPSGVAHVSEDRSVVVLDLPEVPAWGSGTAEGSVRLRYRRAGLRPRLNSLVRAAAGRAHPPLPVEVTFAPAPTGHAVAELHLPDPSATYRWRGGERSADAPSWRLSIGRGRVDLTTGDA